MAIVLGLMSGTSMDGIDAAVCDIKMARGMPQIKLVSSVHFPYPKKLRARLFSLISGEESVAEVCRLNVAIGEAFSKAALKGMGQKKIKLIGSHGQTLFHSPKTGSTLQIGSPAVIACKTGAPVWADFRSADMAGGGEGAPLAPVIHLPLFMERTINVSVLNIGGIANITHIPAGAKTLNQLVAYDTGPGNMLIDFATMRMEKGMYDRGGRIARAGEVKAGLLGELLGHRFFKKKAPRSTGREEFGEAFIRWAGLGRSKKWDKNMVATFTELTARTVTSEIKKLANAKRPTDRLVICGGGAKNSFLVERIARLAGETIEVITSDQLGVRCDAIEAMLVALLAFYADRGEAQDLRSITGTKNRKALLGSFTPAPKSR